METADRGLVIGLAGRTGAGKNYIAGLLKNARGFTAVTNPLVNSYKRLVSGYEAPVYSAWSASNRSALIRIPAARGLSTRTELRSPDPSCNPYLALAMMLNAGLDGVKNKILPPDEVKTDIFEMSTADMEEQGITILPTSLAEALAELEASPIARETLGPHIYHKYLKAKKTEWDNYRVAVTDWELESYLASY